VNNSLIVNNIITSEASAASDGGSPQAQTTPISLFLPAFGNFMGDNNLIAYNLTYGYNAPTFPGIKIGGSEYAPSWANFCDTGSTSPDYRFKVAANGTGNSCPAAGQFFNTDPKFSTYPGNLTLQATSPVKSAGTNLSAYFTTDITGATRTSWSMGAYDYGGPCDPCIAFQPQNKSVPIGATATFTVTATGNTALSYQWSRAGTNISGATQSSYTTPAVQLGDNGQIFYVTLSDTAGSVQSANATLSVTGPMSTIKFGGGVKLGKGVIKQK
jgi:hypothetical protein